MAAWIYACKTIQGKNLDLKLLSRGNIELRLIKGIAGSGRVSPVQLIALTDVIDPVQEVELHKIVEYPEESKIMLPVILKNTDAAARYTIHQLGIYAQDPDLGEILYLILQSDGPEEVPSEEEMKDFTLEWYLNLSVSDTANVEVVIDENGYASTGDLNAVESRVAEIEEFHESMEEISDDEVEAVFEDADAAVFNVEGKRSFLYFARNSLRKLCNLIKEHYVRKEEGKGLSSNDYTAEDMAKLEGIEENANAYSHPTDSGNRHIPEGGVSGNILGWSSDGTAEWKAQISLINNLLATDAGVGALDAYQGKVLKNSHDTLNTKVTELAGSLSATKIIKTGSKDMGLSTTETWYRLGYLENGSKFFGEFLVCSSWNYNIPDICKFIVGGANNSIVSYNIVKQFYSHRGVGQTGANMTKRIKKIRVCYYPSGLDRNIYVDVCLQSSNTKVDGWSYELSMYRDGVAGSPSRWVNSNFEANPVIPSGYAVKELNLEDMNVSEFILYRTFTKDNFTVGANAYTSTTIPYTVPAGYKMLCVTYVDIDNATTAGNNKSNCSNYSIKWDSANITVFIKNRATSEAKLKLEARVLFILDRNI